MEVNADTHERAGSGHDRDTDTSPIEPTGLIVNSVDDDAALNPTGEGCATGNTAAVIVVAGENARVAGNTLDGNGIAILVEYGSATVEKNTAGLDSGSTGPGLAVSAGTVEATDNTFANSGGAGGMATVSVTSIGGSTPRLGDSYWKYGTIPDPGGPVIFGAGRPTATATPVTSATPFVPVGAPIPRRTLARSKK